MSNLLEQLLKQREELDRQIEALQNPHISRVPRNERYYFINSKGSVECYNDHDDSTDTNLYAYGNYFPTRESAEEFRDYIKAMSLIFRHAKSNGEYDRNKRDMRWYVEYYKDSCEFALDNYASFDPLTPSFPSEEAGREFLDKYGDTLKELLRVK